MLVLRGTKGEIWQVLYWTRRGGVLIVIAALIELFAQVSTESGGPLTASSLFSVATSTFGIAVALRIGGGIALSIGSSFDLTHAATSPESMISRSHAAASPARQLVAAASSLSLPPESVEFSPPHQHTPVLDRPGDLMWRATPESALAFAGVATLLTSYAFDGHTVTKGDRLVTGALNAVHVAGGAVWLGGIVMLAAILNRRKKAGVDLRALPLALRFSTVASAALVAVGLAGAALSVTILDSIDEIWLTPWGRLLIAKVFVVAVAGGAGAYNHFELIPRLERTTSADAISEEFRFVVTVEAALLLLSVVLTAFLIGSAS